jgi:hypothetical protein
VGAVLLSGIGEAVYATPHVNACTAANLANPVYPNTPDSITDNGA